jgi:hypothetical protein
MFSPTYYSRTRLLRAVIAVVGAPVDNRTKSQTYPLIKNLTPKVREDVLLQPSVNGVIYRGRSSTQMPEKENVRSHSC